MDPFIKTNKITQAEELKAEERLVKEPKSVSKQTIARNSLEIPEKDQPLDELKKKVDKMLNENNKDMLNKLTLNANIDLTANLSKKPKPSKRPPRKEKGKSLQERERILTTNRICR